MKVLCNRHRHRHRLIPVASAVLVLPLLLLLANVNYVQSIGRGNGTQYTRASRMRADDADLEYGITWVLMPDANDMLRMAYLTPPEGYTLNVNTGSIRFELYNSNGFQTAGNGPATDLSLFDPNKWTVFLVHGWMSNPYHAHISEARKNYLQHMDVNVILMDWREIAHDSLYFFTVSAASDVGRHLALTVDTMTREMGLDLKKTHLVGHSVGAHVVGMAGSSLTTGSVARITGLDPAGPGFIFKGPNLRLDQTDADFVDVIHTSAGTSGHFLDLGHVDFYPNGGANQPNCSLDTFLASESCSHGRAWNYYAESIVNNQFFAYNCKNYKQKDKCVCNPDEYEMMGAHTSHSARGIYYVAANGRPPFAYGPMRETDVCLPGFY